MAYPYLRARSYRAPLPTRLDRHLARAASALSFVFVAAIVASIAAVAALYVTTLRPLLAAALLTPAPRAGADPSLPPPPAAPPRRADLALAAHTAAAVWLLLSVTVHYALALLTPAGSPRAALDAAALDAETPPSLPHAPAAPAAPAAPQHAPQLPPPPAYLTASQTWRWCVACAAPKPPRAHHDATTDTCALQMCHYCPAVGGVVGLRNYPHFFRFLLHAWLGALLASASCAFLNRRLDPAVAATWRGDAVFFCAAGSSAVAVAVGVLLAFHCYLLSTGQTTIEFYENWAARRQGLISAFPFDAGLRANVAAAFGPPIHRRLPWWSVFLLVDFRRPPVPSYMLCQPDPKARDDAYCMQLD